MDMMYGQFRFFLHVCDLLCILCWGNEQFYPTAGVVSAICITVLQCQCTNLAITKAWNKFSRSMGLLPSTYNCGCACAGNDGNVMHAGIANSRFPLNLAAGGNVPGIPGACATRNYTYLVRGPRCMFNEMCIKNIFMIIIDYITHRDRMAHIHANKRAHHWFR